MLTWKTASETSNEGFHIERSADGGASFADAAFVKGARTTTTVRLTVYDALGRRVWTLVSEEQQGRQAVSFEAKELASGTYFCRLEAGARVFSTSMVLVR